jgi:hypothetical protein
MGYMGYMGYMRKLRWGIPSQPANGFDYCSARQSRN